MRKIGAFIIVQSVCNENEVRVNYPSLQSYVLSILQFFYERINKKKQTKAKNNSCIIFEENKNFIILG